MPTLTEITRQRTTSSPRVVKRRAQPDKIYADFSDKSSFRWVPTDAIYVDRVYQRTLDKGRTTKMAHKWNQNLAGAMVVSKRSNGHFYVVDGQHRHAAIQAMENPPEFVYCQVFEGLTVEEEALLFHDLDTLRRSLTSGQAFTALMAAKDPAALGITRAAEANGLTVDYNRGAVAGNLRAFKTLQLIYHRSGEEMLTRILRVVSQAWPTDPHAGASTVLKGLETFLKRYPTANHRLLVESLGRTTPGQIDAQARAINGSLMSSAIDKAVSNVILANYNKGKRTGRLGSPSN